MLRLDLEPTDRVFESGIHRIYILKTIALSAVVSLSSIAAVLSRGRLQESLFA